MKWLGLRAFLPLALAVAPMAACDKAKDALKDALGADKLEPSEIDALLQETEWKKADGTLSDPKLASFKILGGIKLTDKFKGDLGEADAKIPVPFLEVPKKAEGAAQNQRSFALLKKVEFTIGDKTYKRFQILTVASYDAENKQIVLSSDKVNQFIDDAQQVKLANDNQAGEYILVEGEGDKNLAYLSGTVELKKDTVEAKEAVADAIIFTSSSPFVTKTGSSGKYFLAILSDSKGTVTAFKGNIGSTATGTPTSTSVDIPYAGALDQYKGAFTSKVDSLGSSEVTGKADELFNSANTKISDKLGLWTLVEANLLFVQPKQAKPADPTPPPAKGDDPPAPTQPEPQPGTKPIDEPPPPDSPVMREPPTDDPAYEPGYNIDLGCSGFEDRGDDFEIFDFVRNGALFDDYAANKGWRATGDVRYSYEMAEVIFGAPEDENLGRNYLDGVTGYCLLTTGNSLYKLSEDDTAYLPGPAGGDQVSEMWQKVKVPTDAKSIQVRVAFMSQEFPKFVGTQYNDSFFIKFDESLSYIASGNLNDLAGMNSTEAAVADSAKACSSSPSLKNLTCGDWKSISMYSIGEGEDKVTMHGEIGTIFASTTAQAKGRDYGCEYAGTDPAEKVKCYHGMISPRIICKDLTADEAGKLLTLRVNVSDVGDKYFDSALAVDSIVFSKKACGEGDRMTPEDLSRVSEL